MGLKGLGNLSYSATSTALAQAHKDTWTNTWDIWSEKPSGYVSYLAMWATKTQELHGLTSLLASEPPDLKNYLDTWTTWSYRLLGHLSHLSCTWLYKSLSYMSNLAIWVTWPYDLHGQGLPDHCLNPLDTWTTWTTWLHEPHSCTSYLTT